MTLSGFILSEGALENYRGAAAEWLQEHGLKIWSQVTIVSEKGVFKGILLPRGEQGDDQHIVVKLRNGYNIGLKIETIQEIKETGAIEPSYKIPEKEIEKDPEKPTVVLIGTGGTLASKIDYQSGAVVPAFTTQELFHAVPELQEIANLETKSIFQILSENIQPDHWIELTNEVVNSIEKLDPAGVVIAHGTDTMHFTAAALSFMIKNLDRPVVLVGAQRSSDRPSSDAPINLLSSVRVACESDIAEVVVCMHGSTSDDYNLVHRGTRVRKMHTSRRDAFKTIDELPLAKVVGEKIIPSKIPYNKRQTRRAKIEIDTQIDKKVALVFSYPGLKAEILDYFIDQEYSGIVLAGTGLGHINQKLLPIVERAQEEDIPIFMASQCLWGYTGMNVYETGRLLKRAGVIPLANMLPEVALVKAMWVLGHTKEIPFVKELMQKNLTGEITERETFDGFQIGQAPL